MSETKTTVIITTSYFTWQQHHEIKIHQKFLQHDRERSEMGNILPSWQIPDLVTDLLPRTLAQGKNEKSDSEPDFLKPITKALITQLDEYARRLGNAREEARAKLESQMMNINATFHADTDNATKNIDRTLEKLKKSEAFAAVCITEHQKELTALQNKYVASTQKCVNENIGPFLQAAKQFELDIDTYAANAQKLAKEGLACTTSACALAVGQQFAKLHIMQSKALAEDYIEMDLKGVLVIDAVRRCAALSVAKDANELTQFVDIILKCVNEKKAAGLKSRRSRRSSSK